MNWADYYKYDENVPSGLIRIKATKGLKAGTMAGTLTPKTNRWSVVFNYKRYVLCRIIWQLEIGPIPEGMEIDHIDGNPSNNRLANLRLATRSQNACNIKRKRRELPSGVSWCNGTYCARVSVKGKVKRKFGMDIHALSEWVKVTKLELHGEFANLN